MKKPLLSIKAVYLWNKLVRKFINAYNRFLRLNAADDSAHVQSVFLLSRLQKLFQRLLKLQTKTGIKLAGSALALMLLSAQAGAQNYVGPEIVSKPGINTVSFGLISRVATGDIDNDGDADVIVGEYLGGVSVVRNDGGGDFTYTGLFQADGMAISTNILPTPTLADVDEDGDLDLYLGLYEGTISMFVNDGSGVFSQVPGGLMADGATLDIGNGAAPAFADLDNDGDLDLYVGEQGGTVSVFTNNGSGVFSSAGLLQADAANITVGTWMKPVFYDFDSDGDLDLFTGDQSGVIKKFSNNGIGVLSAAGNVQSDGVDIFTLAFSTPAFIDIDGDSDIDLVSGSYFGTVKVYTNDGSGVLSDTTDLQAYNVAFPLGEFTAPAFADLDDDGDLDLYVGTRYGKIAALINNGSGVFSMQQNLTAGGTEINTGNLVFPEFADIDQDGDLDLYLGLNDGYIMFYENNGLGQFAAGVNLVADAADIDVGNHAQPDFADLDGDGDLDLYVGNNSGYILVFENGGLGAFSSVGNFEADGADLAVFAFASPDFADLDGDGDLDLLVGQYYGQISVYINNAGVFNVAPGSFEANGNVINNGLIAIPEMANTDGSCGDDLFLGGIYAPMVKYTYVDTLAPTITCPSALTYNLLQYQSTYTVPGNSLNPVSFADNCMVESVLNDFNGTSSLAGAEFNAGNYMVLWTVTDVDGNTAHCSVDVNINVYNAIEDLAGSGIYVYPNPSTGVFTIENAENTNITVSDAFGKVLFESAENTDPKTEIDLSAFPTGVYFLTIDSGKGRKTVKLIRE